MRRRGRGHSSSKPVNSLRRPPPTAGPGSVSIPPTKTSAAYDPGDTSVAAPPGSIRVTIHHVHEPSPAEELRAAIVRDPCGTLGHRWAWLVAGGQECVQCGARR